jgi:hypothetical protein
MATVKSINKGRLRAALCFSRVFHVEADLCHVFFHEGGQSPESVVLSPIVVLVDEA